MAAQQQGGQEGADKNAYYILWLMVLITVVAGAIWYVFDLQLKQFFISLRVYELTAVRFCLELLPADLPMLGGSIQQYSGAVGVDLGIANGLTPTNLDMDTAFMLSMTAGEYLRYPIAGYLVLLVITLFHQNVQARLKKKHNMKTLALQEQINWPQIKIATKADILNQDLDSGPWAMAMSPIQFSKKNRLVCIEHADASLSPFSKMQAPEYKITLDRVRAERAFSVQLGRAWQGIEAMPMHRRAIFAIFAARGSRDTKAALALVAQLSRSAADGKLDCTGADSLWKKHYKTKPVQAICARHAYEFTIFISLLQFAREDGVVASADFLWIKPIDRRLWYVINNVGRQTPSVEVGGIFCHWYHEMALKRPLNAPRVEGAVDALAIALSELIYIPDEEEKEEIIKRRDAQETGEQ